MRLAAIALLMNEVKILAGLCAVIQSRPFSTTSKIGHYAYTKERPSLIKEYFCSDHLAVYKILSIVKMQIIE